MHGHTMFNVVYAIDRREEVPEQRNQLWGSNQNPQTVTNLEQCITQIDTDSQYTDHTDLTILFETPGC